MPGEFCTEKGVDFFRGCWDILHGNRYMLVGKTPFLKLSDTNMVQNRAHECSNILHECRKILLKDAHDEIGSVIGRLTRP
jgi:hypothetical protein